MIEITENSRPILLQSIPTVANGNTAIGQGKQTDNKCKLRPKFETRNLRNLSDLGAHVIMTFVMYFA